MNKFLWAFLLLNMGIVSAMHFDSANTEKKDIERQIADYTTTIHELSVLRNKCTNKDDEIKIDKLLLRLEVSRSLLKNKLSSTTSKL